MVIEPRMLGYPHSVIHRKLLDGKKITMPSGVFFYNVRRHIYNREYDGERARTTEERRKKEAVSPAQKRYYSRRKEGLEVMKKGP